MKQLAFILLLIICFSCDSGEEKAYEISGSAFGTTYYIKYFALEEQDIQRGIDSVIYDFNRSVNTYMAESTISKINRGDSTVVVDSIFRGVFELSEKINKATNGFFDPTVGVLRNAYGFGDVEPMKEIDSVKLDSLRNYVGFEKVSITSAGTVRKQSPYIYFDFNAIAKGYGIDYMGAYLKSEGIKNFLIELGGEVLVSGINQSTSRPWIVGIEAVSSELDNRSLKQSIFLEDEAMASSGNYRKYRIDSLTGKKYVHTINPHTGMAEEGDITSASVVAADCATADAYATAFMAMGFNRTKKVLEISDGLEAYITYLDSLNNEKVFMTSGIKERIPSD